MATIICNITNLDAINAIRGLQNIVRTVVSRVSVSVVRGVQSVRVQYALTKRYVDLTAKPAYAMLPSTAAPAAMPEHASSGHRWHGKAGSLGSFASCPGRVDLG